MNRFLCIHGHFYQPPRENPWLEAVETQDSAAPYHDWNERVTTECYANNSASRILDDDLRIVDIVSNYTEMSFDMGPTLLSWMEDSAPEIYNAVIEADALSMARHSGHGAAIAQAYSHMIMPLANSRDKATQVRWGLEDFRHRFGRDPEGMWLPETAVDLETLDIMAAEGIKFTLLAPHQASRVRRIGVKSWYDISGAKVDPKRAYVCALPSGKTMTIFFYDGPISRAVAFEHLLNSGEEFARRLVGGFSDKKSANQLMHIATDGESYGHHHRFGEMALSFALYKIESKGLAVITNYGEFLAENPPAHEIEIFENTSWSCSHGIERWRDDCGCGTGANPKWNQKWRAPLRKALDSLRDKLAAGYESASSKLFKDPWAARDDYISVILDRSEENLERFLAKHSLRSLSEDEIVTARKLLELQRHAMLMYTSCGWFFDDISGIETVQILQYAGRAIQLAKETTGTDHTPEFVGVLEAAKSNVTEQKDGASIYEHHVTSMKLDLQKVAAHYAINSLFEDYATRASIYCYEVESHDRRKLHAGKAVLLTGHCFIKSGITGENGELSFAVIHLGDQDFDCGVRTYVSEDSYREMSGQLHDAFERGELAEVVRLLDSHFGENSYSLKDLFCDEQRAVLETLLEETLEGFENSYRSMYEENRGLMTFLRESGTPIPKPFAAAAEFILNLDLQRRLTTDFDAEAIGEILDEVKTWDVSLNKEDLEFTLKSVLDERMEALNAKASDTKALKEMDRVIGIALSLPFRHNMWLPQNIYFRMAKSIYADFAGRAKADESAAEWVRTFRSLGEKLNFNLQRVLPDK